MLEDYLKEQRVAIKIMKNSILKNKISHAYLIEGDGCKYKSQIALSFAKTLLCPNNYYNNKFCGNCTQCKNIEKNLFSELKIINPDGMWIKKEQLMELQEDFNTKSIQSDKKVYIINDVEKLNISAANSILKFLEEPADNIVAILITNNIYQVLDTIISRCQIISLKNKILDGNIVSKIKSSISYNENLFENDDVFLEKIDKIINFVNIYEKETINTLLKIKKIWLEEFNDKLLLEFGLDNLILIYKDIINYKLNKKFDIYDIYHEELEKIANCNTILKLLKKIDLISQIKDKIKFNVNSDLLMDKLIISLEKGDSNE